MRLRRIINKINDNLAVYLTIMPVGADAHIGPNRHRFWADVGIGPYNCVVYGSTLNDNLQHSRSLWWRGVLVDCEGLDMMEKMFL